MNEVRKQRGVFEKAPGSGAWWIRYADADRKISREKVGNKGAAIKPPRSDLIPGCVN
jgi:hypothetical protein